MTSRLSSDLDDGMNAERYNTVCSNVLEAVASGSTGTTGILPVGNGSRRSPLTLLALFALKSSIAVLKETSKDTRTPR